MARKQLNVEEAAPAVNLYAAREGFVTSGSFLLDLALGGGWAIGRVINVVGDKSSGKTLLAIEAAANFNMIAPLDRLRYVEAEAAFSEAYAQSIGFPIGLDLTGGVHTVQEFQSDLTQWIARKGADKGPGLYTLDSYDALSDDAEMARDLDAASYGAEKAKASSKMFRMINADVERSNTTLFIISQIRDKIGVTFGEKKTRSGGKALDFFASQILWLSEIGKIKATAAGVERYVGLNVRAQVKKNKVGTPFRECELIVRFGYGIDDELSMIEWLKDVNSLSPKEATALRDDLARLRKARDIEGVHTLNQDLRVETNSKWTAIEDALAPPMKKYG